MLIAGLSQCPARQLASFVHGIAAGARGKWFFAPFALYRASRHEDPEMTILRTPTR
jgi:hypothetical protein